MLVICLKKGSVDIHSEMPLMESLRSAADITHFKLAEEFQGIPLTVRSVLMHVQVYFLDRLPGPAVEARQDLALISVHAIRS